MVAGVRLRQEGQRPEAFKSMVPPSTTMPPMTLPWPERNLVVGGPPRGPPTRWDGRGRGGEGVVHHQHGVPGPNVRRSSGGHVEGRIAHESP